ncbi:hypothetical protein BS47DRAFT_1307511 [Hydnum rufescens UP504]|uniref:Reverse transcriptase zinc-binding domain-containing protein n=1 Tax=Hydnum rufescens UP504 TaxID=1448309 RepID=A0A9P6AFN1_9AGAM|nr:hypothetical protein BS47DRAFT_1307511 [Hydnum rufescens UP504]
MLASLPWGGFSIITQLHTGHVALHDYLKCFSHAESPFCLRCQAHETPEHFLVFCTCFTHKHLQLWHDILHTV